MPTDQRPGRATGRRLRPRLRPRSPGLCRAGQPARPDGLPGHRHRGPGGPDRGRDRDPGPTHRDGDAMTYRGRVALLTYSTKPRGGVVHTLALGEALAAVGVDVHVYALGSAGDSFYRATSLPYTLFP